jgi:dienelactone hydrolase
VNKDRYREAAAADAWGKITTFLDANLQ